MNGTTSPTTGTAPRFDPYRNFRFRLKWQGRHVAGFSKVSVLKRATEVVRHRDDGEGLISTKSPGRAEYDAITLERGITHDREFERWAHTMWNDGSGRGAALPLEDFRSEVTVELLDEGGQLLQRYTLCRCWVSEFQAVPDLDADANAVAIQVLKLEHEGWTRDRALTGPAAPEP